MPQFRIILFYYCTVDQEQSRESLSFVIATEHDQIDQELSRESLSFATGSTISQSINFEAFYYTYTIDLHILEGVKISNFKITILLP